jgi:signal transduction histidine kinase
MKDQGSSAGICERQEEVSETHVVKCDLDGILETIKKYTSALEQVVANLLSNAVKYAPDAPDINVRARQEDDYVLVSVSDRGLGVDSEDLPHLGERFFRAKTSAGIAGTGIGLEVESEKGKGRTFPVRLPIDGPAEKSDAAGPEDEAECVSIDAA